MKTLLVGFLVLIFVGARAETRASTDPKLTIEYEGGSKVFTRKQLNARKDLRVIEVDKDPAHPDLGKQSYWAVPVSSLFVGVPMPPEAVVQFYCLDGFSAPIDRSRLMETDAGRSHAFIAIEQDSKPWPKLGSTGASAGPFYLIWLDPKLSNIGPEEWPFQLAGFRVHASFEKKFPKLLPASDASPSIQKGFASFRKNCFSCHTLNKEGESNMGPDLNLPMNPTEYLQEAALKTLIRNPKNVRTWPQAQMPGFDAQALTDEDLDNLLAYLKHMAARK